jgi:peroxiredoxin
MRTFASLALAAALSFSAFTALSLPACAQAAPRKAPDLTITEPSGKQIPLASLKGKVCVIEFLFTTCPHCQKESQLLSKLQQEYGPRGLQVLGVAVNDNAAVLVPAFVQQFGVNYPIGYAPNDTMTSFMQISAMERWSVPQVAVIDRKGMIRAQTPYNGDPNLQTESYMRNLIETLLKEGGATSKSGKPTSSQ